MRSALKFLLVLWVAICVMLAVRALCFTTFTVEGAALEPALINGDRVLVNKWSYGLRTVGFGREDYVRWFEAQPRRGDLVAFNYPPDGARRISDRPVYVCFCTGLPGDTVRAADVVMTVPGRMHALGVTPRNASLVSYIYNHFEGRRSAVRDGRLYVDGRQVRCASFTRDYYWMSSSSRSNANDSRLFGFVPADCLIGRVSMLLYSVDPARPFFYSLRRGRALLFLQNPADSNANP